MDRSFSVSNKQRAIMFAVSAGLGILLNLLNNMMGENYSTIYSSVYATIILVMFSNIILVSNEQFSKWNSFLIASGTDRSDFMRTRFTVTVGFCALSAALYTCIDFVNHGINNNTTVLLLLNMSIALAVSSVFILIFCHMGMTVKSQSQMTGLIAMWTLLVIVCGSVSMNIADVPGISVTPFAVVLVVSAAITAICYFVCMRRIRTVDM